MLCSLADYLLYKQHYILEGFNLSMDYFETLSYHNVCFYVLGSMHHKSIL